MAGWSVPTRAKGENGNAALAGVEGRKRERETNQKSMMRHLPALVCQGSTSCGPGTKPRFGLLRPWRAWVSQPGTYAEEQTWEACECITSLMFLRV